MAMSSSFAGSGISRAPGGGGGGGSRSPSGAPSSYFTAADHFSHYGSSYSPLPHSHELSDGGHNGREVLARHDFQQVAVKDVETGRPYPLLERRSFRDVSSSGDMVLSREDFAANGGGSGAASRGRNTPTVGAIGDGRKSASSPDKQSNAGGWDGRGALSSLEPATNAQEGTSRPSSFILDVLPTRSNDSCAAGSTPSLSLDSPSTDRPSETSNLSAAIAASSLFNSPTPDTSALSPLPSTIRANSPSPADAAPITSIEVLSQRLISLESTVGGLSSLVNNEVRSLREEVGVLRGLVLQSTSFNGGPRTLAHHGEASDSPLLTLRSPSPHQSSFPLPPRNPGSTQPQHALSYLSTTSIPPSPAHSAPGVLYSDRGDDRTRTTSVDGKDEQIRALTAQLSSLSNSVAHLMNGGSVGLQSPSTSPVISQHQNQRQMSLPIGSPSSPGIGSLVEGWKAGLGVSANGTALGGRAGMMRPGSANGIVGGRTGSGFGRGEMEERRRSQLGFGAVGQSALRLDGSNFDSGSQSTWETASANGGMPSPLAGLVSSSINGSPPGSLGGKWEVLGIGAELFRTIAKYGLGPPTKIQSKAIPCVLRNQDIVAQAPSIQERIQSYIVPALQLVCSAAAQATAEGTSSAPRGVQILVVTATVDQAAQAQRLSVGLGGSLGIRTSLCVGQGDLQQDLATFLKAPPHVLVGTPQRLLDLFSMRTLPVNDIRLLVIDECDQLIARNLSDYVANLVRLLPSSGVGAPGSPTTSKSPMLGGGLELPGSFGETGSGFSMQSSPTFNAAVSGRQTVLLSCTCPQDVLNFASSLQLREPVRVLVRREGGDSSSPSVRGLKQYYLYIAVGAAAKSKAVGVGRREATTAREWKLEALADLCEDYAFENCVIFCSSVDAVEAVTYKLGTRAIEALALHQDMGQSARHAIMSKFRSAVPSRTGPNKRCLVVYDALCRTLTDVHQVPLVINYDLPRDVESYVHRIACATASGYGRPGVAINIVTPGADVDMLRAIESFYRCKITELPPSFSTSA